MTTLGTVGAVTKVDEVAATGPLKLTRVTFVGDGAYHAGGSLGFSAAFDTEVGERRTIVAFNPTGVNGDVGLEYTPKGPKLTATVVASSNLFTSAAHGLAAGDPVQFFADNGGDADLPDPVLPAGVTAGTTYYVIASGLTSDAFKVSTGLAGSTIDVTTSSTHGMKVQKQDTMLVRVPSTGAESSDASQDDTTYTGIVTSY